MHREVFELIRYGIELCLQVVHGYSYCFTTEVAVISRIRISDTLPCSVMLVLLITVLKSLAFFLCLTYCIYNAIMLLLILMLILLFGLQLDASELDDEIFSLTRTQLGNVFKYLKVSIFLTFCAC